MVTPVIGVVASSANAGKTTLIEKLIRIFKAKGLRVGVLKHTTHQIEGQKPGKDSWRHVQAGADTVALASPDTFLLEEKLQPGYELNSLLTKMQDLDLIIVEGFKSASIPKVEVYQDGVQESIASSPEELIAITGNKRIDFHEVPWFFWEDIESLADLIVKKVLKGG